MPVLVRLDPPGDELREPREKLSQLDPLDGLLVVGRKFASLSEVAIPGGVHPVLADLVQGEAAQQRQEGVIMFQVLARSLILTCCICVDTFSLLRHLHLLGNVTIPLGIVLAGEILSYLVSIYTLLIIKFLHVDNADNI